MPRQMKMTAERLKALVALANDRSRFFRPSDLQTKTSPSSWWAKQLRWLHKYGYVDREARQMKPAFNRMGMTDYLYRLNEKGVQTISLNAKHTLDG